MKKSQKSWSTNEMQNGLYKSANFSSHSRLNKKFMKISARVTGKKLVNNGKYVVYNIYLSTEFNDWNIKKRYSEFDALNQSLIKKIPEINQYFPPKRFFKNSDETIDERVKYFNKYLHKLFNNYDIFQFEEVIDFICIDKKILELAISKHTMGNKNKENEPIYASVKKSILHLTNNERSSSFDNNEGKKNIDILGNTFKTNKNVSSNNKDNINRNLNINNEINAKNNNDNINKIYNNKDNYNWKDYEENNKNYFSSLLEYENSKKSSEDLQSESPYYRIIEEFLKNLNKKNDNKTAIVKSFEEFLKKDNSWPNFTSDEIIKLFIGIKNYKNKKNDSDDNDTVVRRAITSKIINGKLINKDVRKSMGKQVNNNDSLSLSESSSSSESDDDSNIKIKDKNEHSNDLFGLFALIGNYEKNILLSASCLDLLMKFLSIEYNPKAELYLNIFKSRRIIDYQNLKLEDIIRDNICGEKSTINAMKLLSILFKDTRMNQYKRVILKNDNVFKKFNIFEKNYYD